MQGHAQVSKPTTEKPSKTIHLWRINRDPLACGISVVAGVEVRAKMLCGAKFEETCRRL